MTAAVRSGLKGIALTDHDTADGLEEAAEEAGRAGLEFLPGAELSANEPDRSVHILAYGFDVDDPGLRRFFDEYRRDRNRRARQIVERLRRLQVRVGFEDVLEEAGRGVVTRAHIGRALVRVGAVPDQQAAFERWLGRRSPAYVSKRPTPPALVFRLVRAAGGVSILAHPGRTHGPEAIRRWVGEGLNGVEVMHPVNPPEIRSRLDRLASELRLLRGGGSDWHGPDSARAVLGAERVPDTWMDEITAAVRALQADRNRPGSQA